MTHTHTHNSIFCYVNAWTLELQLEKIAWSVKAWEGRGGSLTKVAIVLEERNQEMSFGTAAKFCAE